MDEKVKESYKEKIKEKVKRKVKAISEAISKISKEELESFELMDRLKWEGGLATSDLRDGIIRTCEVAYEWIYGQFKEGMSNSEAGEVASNFYAVITNYGGVLDDLVRRIKAWSKKRGKLEIYRVDFGGPLFMDYTLILDEAMTARIEVRAKKVYLLVAGPFPNGQWVVKLNYARKAKKANHIINSGLTVEVIPLLEGKQET